ncbi:MAG: hypothetical protein MHMPM18_004163, partial [Marteilia pararefringens]
IIIISFIRHHRINYRDQTEIYFGQENISKKADFSETPKQNRACNINLSNFGYFNVKEDAFSHQAACEERKIYSLNYPEQN